MWQTASTAAAPRPAAAAATPPANMHAQLDLGRTTLPAAKREQAGCVTACAWFEGALQGSASVGGTASRRRDRTAAAAVTGPCKIAWPRLHSKSATARRLPGLSLLPLVHWPRPAGCKHPAALRTHPARQKPTAARATSTSFSPTCTAHVRRARAAGHASRWAWGAGDGGGRVLSHLHQCGCNRGPLRSLPGDRETSI